jgi:lactoylglutathione lyase
VISAPSINLLVLRARDPDRLVWFYTTLGFTFTPEKHGEGPQHYACEVGGFVLEIYPQKDGEATSQGARLGFEVPSIDMVLARLGKDADLVSPPRTWNETKRCVLKDPEGHKVELVETNMS